MKKPQAIIGLLAALGTTIGVLVAVLGLPYGRADYSAFAELYQGPTDSVNTSGGWFIAVDTVPGNGDSTEFSKNIAHPGPLSTTIDVVAANSGSTASVQLTAWEFKIVHTDPLRLIATVPGSCIAPSLNCNPDFNEGFNTGTWDCSAVPPSADLDLAPGDKSFLGCFNTPLVNNSQFVANDSVIGTLGTITYDIPIAAPLGTVPLAVVDGALYSVSFEELGTCNVPLTLAMPCFDGEISLVLPPTPTVTNTPEPSTATNTPIPPTATSTSTNTPIPPTATNTPADPQIIKIPEQCANGGDAGDGNADCSDPLMPLANLFLCEAPALCAGQGEGNLIVFEYANAVQAGLGAYEFSVEYDNFVIKSVNPCDVVFGPIALSPQDLNNPGGADGVADGEGSARGPVDELNASTASGNPHCSDDPGPIANNGTCSLSIVLENIIHFGCVTLGQVAGPTGSMDIAALNLIPHEDLRNDIFPGNNNGVVTILKDNGCELVDTLGHPVPGSINGGLTVECGDIAVTVRILEGDLDLDCDVDLTDAQAIAGHYGAFFGGLLYSKWLDLEPQFHDLDIDIKDIQKVFGRQGSTCQTPIPAQPPVPFN